VLLAGAMAQLLKHRMLTLLMPFLRYSASNIGVTLTSGLEVTQDN